MLNFKCGQQLYEGFDGHKGTPANRTPVAIMNRTAHQLSVSIERTRINAQGIHPHERQPVATFFPGQPDPLLNISKEMHKVPVQRIINFGWPIPKPVHLLERQLPTLKCSHDHAPAGRPKIKS